MGRGGTGWLLWLALVGCDGGASGEPAELPTRLEARLPGGATVSLDPGEAVETLPAPADRFAWALSDGTRITLQTVAREGELPPGEERTPATVAAALALRVELGEAEGELAHHPCSVGAGRPGVTAECVVGSQTTESGDHWLRRGAVFAAGADMVWLDVASPTEEIARAHADAVRESVVVR